MESKFDKLLTFSTVFIHIFAFSGLVYRSQIYPHIPVAPEEPYGLGDVIDLLFAFVIVITWFCAFISAIAVTLFNIKHNWLTSLKTLLYASVALIGYFYVKTI